MPHPHSPDGLSRPGFHRVLEKSRAGFGAAGLAAVLAEAVASTKFFSTMNGGDHAMSYFIVGLIALAAFVGAALVVDLPEGSRSRR